MNHEYRLVQAPVSGSNGLGVGKVDTLDSKRILRDVPITIIAPPISTGGSSDSVFTEHYDGDPAKGGTLFDTQHTPRVFAVKTFVDSAHYQAQTCGLHEIFVRAIPIGGVMATSSAKFKVTSDPVAAINGLITFIKSPASPRHPGAAMLAYLAFAKKAFQANRQEEGAVAMKLLLKVVRDLDAMKYRAQAEQFQVDSTLCIGLKDKTPPVCPLRDVVRNSRSDDTR